MEAYARPSGIPAIGDIPWGTHFCHFYLAQKDLFEFIAPFVLTGLAHNEECLLITADPLETEEVRRRLRALLPNLENLEASRQLDIISHQDWYARLTQSDPAELLKGWLQREEEALKRGRAGLRITGNLSWVSKEDWKDYSQYEAKLTRLVASRRIIGACSYGLARRSAEDVLDVIENHRFTLAYREAALGMVESGALRLANARLRKLNEELEQRVQQRTAELERALRVQEAFLSVASHELKTPVTSLHLHLDALLRAQRRSLSRDELEKRVHKAREQCKRVEALVDRLLDVSQAGTGRLPLHIEEVNLGELARTVVDQLSEQAERAGCTVRVKVDGPVLGHWDRTRMEQVVLSLLSNAFKYAPGSPVEMTVQRLGDQAVLRVRDEGMGISAKDQQRIFERFTPVSPGPRASGFGLGLWMVRQTVEALGGRIEVASELGRGAIFTVTLPLPGSPDPSQGLSGRG